MSDTFLTSQFIGRAFKRFLPNTQAISLAVILSVIFLLIYSLSDLLMPVFASIVIAYLLEGIVKQFEKRNMARMPSVYVVFSLFLSGLSFLLFYLIPLVSQQAIELFQLFPDMLNRAQTIIMRLPKMYPRLITENKIQEMLILMQKQLLGYSDSVISISAESIVNLISAMIYLFLVPMMVFFWLKDKDILINWFLDFMPKDRYLTTRVWQEVDTQIGNYVRGKMAEVLILCALSFATFSWLDLNYAVLLSVLMGLQVIIPYIGATLVTFPVLGVAYFEWGFEGDSFMMVAIAYSIIQALDGVLLVPILFSEAVNLHAIAIVVAILFFGGLWGFWGIFFAIPLATVVKAVLTAWPRLGHLHSAEN